MRRSTIAALVLVLLLEAALSPKAWTEELGPPQLPKGASTLNREWSTDPHKFTFAILGDRTDGTPEEWPVFDRAIAELNLLQPDFVIMAGDLIQGYIRSVAEPGAQWEEFLQHVSKLEVPFLALPGNHDIYSKGSYDLWKHHFGDTYYSFVYKGCLFLVLNTEEIYGLDRAVEVDSLGAAQVEWAIDTLAQYPDVRHTFVLLHRPIWNEVVSEQSNAPVPSWGRIEEAVGERPHTFIAAHYHRTSFEKRENRNYFVTASTKGAVVRETNANPQTGAFPHFTLATVDGDSVRLSLIEPGGIWPMDVAPARPEGAMRSILSFESSMPEGLGTNDGRIAFTTIMQNTMPSPVTVTTTFSGLDGTGWRRGDDHPLTVVIAPDVTESVTWRLISSGQVVPVPRIHQVVEHDGNAIVRSSQNIPLYPDSALRYPPEWKVIGPYKGAQPMQTVMPPNPRESMAWIFERQGPEDGFQGGKTFEFNGMPLEWRSQEAINQDGAGFVNVGASFDIPFDEYAYATAAVYSPEAKRVYARFRVDDYGIVYLNGEMLEPGLMRTRRDATWIAFDLKEGWNTVVVKNAAITGGWTFWLGLGDPGGTLRFAPYPPER